MTGWVEHKILVDLNKTRFKALGCRQCGFKVGCPYGCRQAKITIVGKLKCLFEGFELKHACHRAKYFFAGDAGVRINIGKDHRAYKRAIGERTIGWKGA